MQLKADILLGVAISSCAGANARHTAAGEANLGAVWRSCSYEAANARVTLRLSAILTPLITGYVAGHFAKEDNFRGSYLRTV